VLCQELAFVAPARWPDGFDALRRILSFRARCSTGEVQAGCVPQSSCQRAPRRPVFSGVRSLLRRAPEPDVCEAREGAYVAVLV